MATDGIDHVLGAVDELWGLSATEASENIDLFFADGRIVLNVIVLDITEQAKNEELLLQASETARIGQLGNEFSNQKRMVYIGLQ
jgi:hypothetical protein